MEQATYKSFKSTRCFGAEFECGSNISRPTIRSLIESVSSHTVHSSEQYEKSSNNNFWHVKLDSTCGPRGHLEKDYGVEIASYKASGIKDIVHIGKVMDTLRKNNVQVNNNCGFHIHAEIAEFTKAQAGTLLALWCKIEPVISMLVPERRINNKHCKLWTTSRRLQAHQKQTASEFWESMKPTNFAAFENPHKRVTLNFVNYAHSLELERTGYSSSRKTVELRMPEGTLVGSDIKNWIRLLILFVDNSTKLKMPANLAPIETLEELFEIIGLSEANKFTFLSRGLCDTKRWIIKKMIKSELTVKNRYFKEFNRQAEEKMALMNCEKIEQFLKLKSRIKVRKR